VETEHGERLTSTPTSTVGDGNLRRATDAAAIGEFASAVRSLSKFKMPDPTEAGVATG